ncbi:MAG: hypothetical protein ACI93R_002748 [Flavobacteriales bacterium]|jgi:hypothetical protein
MKKALFVPLPFFGHIIPTIKLANRLKNEGWNVQYFVVDEYSDWLKRLGFDVIVDIQNDELKHVWFTSNTEGLLRKIDRYFIGNIPDIGSFDLLLFDYATSIYAAGVIKRGIRSVTYLTCADCDSKKSLPLCDPNLNGHSVLSRIRPKLFWRCIRIKYKTLEYLQNLVRNWYGFRQVRTNDDSDDFESLKLPLFPSAYNKKHIDSNTIILGPRSLSQKNLHSSRYFGYYLDKVCAPNNTTVDTIFRTNDTISYLSFGSSFGKNINPKETPKILKIFLWIIEFYSQGNSGALIVQAGDFINSLTKYESSSIKIIHYADQQLMITRSQFAIIHGGFGSTKECIQSGTPLIVVPNNYDQYYNAGVIEKLEVGRAIYPKKTTREHVEIVIKDVLNNPIYSDNVEALYLEETDAIEFDTGYSALMSKLGFSINLAERYEDKACFEPT